MQSVLKHRKDFEVLLADYKPAPEAIDILAQIPLVILLGVTGSGRNTIINHLVATGRYKFIVSDTTRPPKVRDGALERNGIQYNFRTEEAVLEDIRRGKFLEAELIHSQQVSGISIRELEQAMESGKIPINEVDLGGTDAIFAAKPDTHFFFIIPPSYDIWMQRLQGREQMTPQELQNRMETAMKVLEKGLTDEHFSFVINDSSLDSANKIDEQVHGQRDNKHHAEAAAVAKQILQAVKAHHFA